MEWIRKTWGRWATVAVVAISAGVVGFWPGGDLFLVDLAYNIVRAAAALIMFEGMLRYSTRKISEGVSSARPQREGAPRVRFADVFLSMKESPIALSIFVAAGMLARAQIVVAVWK